MNGTFLTYLGYEVQRIEQELRALFQTVHAHNGLFVFLFHRHDEPLLPCSFFPSFGLFPEVVHFFGRCLSQRLAPAGQHLLNPLESLHETIHGLL